VTDNGKTDYQFYQLPLERSRIDMFNMNWTVVHPINEDSPLSNFTLQDFRDADFELMVQVTGFDPVYSNQVMQMTSYTMDELVWGARFSLMYQQSKEGATTILELDKLNHYEEISLPSNDLQKTTDAVRTGSL
jgi:inward rectifier potassium channel